MLIISFIVILFFISLLVYRVINYDEVYEDEDGIPKSPITHRYPLTYEIIDTILVKLKSIKRNLLRKKIDKVVEGRIRVDKNKLTSLIFKLQKQLSQEQETIAFGENFVQGFEKEHKQMARVMMESVTEVYDGISKDDVEKDKDRLNKLLKIQESY